MNIGEHEMRNSTLGIIDALAVRLLAASGATAHDTGENTTSDDNEPANNTAV